MARAKRVTKKATSRPVTAAELRALADRWIDVYLFSCALKDVTRATKKAQTAFDKQAGVVLRLIRLGSQIA